MNGREVAFVDPFPAKLEGGTKQLRLNAQMPRTPLAISLTFELPSKSGRAIPGLGNLHFFLDQWVGQKVLQLAYFDQIHHFSRALRDGCDLQIQCAIEGNRWFCVRSNGKRLGHSKEIAYIVDVIRKTREIAVWVSRNPVLPRNLTADDLQALDELHWRVEPGDRSRPAAGERSLAIQIGRDAVEAYLASPNRWRDGPVKVSHKNEIISLLGEEVEIGLGEYEFTDAKLEQTDDDLRGQLLELPRKELFILSWVGGEHSEFIVHRPTGAGRLERPPALPA
jgi:hypothetical protein